MTQASRYAYWTNHEIRRLRECYALMFRDELEKEFPRHPISSISDKAWALGLCKRGSRASRNWLAICAQHKPVFDLGGRASA